MGDVLLHAPGAARRREALAAVTLAWGTYVAPLISFATVAALGAAHGGYFPRDWGWSAFALLWIATVALLVRFHVRLRALELALLAGLASLTAWTAFSLLWTTNVGGSLLEVERAVLYVAGVAAVLLVARKRTVSHLLGAILAAITVVSGYGLATRLFPERLGSYDPIAVYRLSEPLGYWNGLGIFAVIGVLLALGFVARARHLAGRALAGAALVVLLPTLYFTFGRGPWVALGVGLAAMIAIDRRRLQLVTAALVAAPAPALAVVLGSRSDGLVRAQSTLAEASRDGHRLALVLAVLAVAAAALTAAFGFAERRVGVGRGVRAAYAAMLLLVVLALVAGVFARYGSPATLASKGYDAFKSPPIGNSDLKGRLFSLSGNGRADFWSVAWKDYRERPWLGGGAGTYEQAWMQNRPTASNARDAHNLYLEGLAELGPAGLALLLGTLAIPLVAAVKVRRYRLAPAAFGAYCAFLIHAGVDWDWEVPAVTLAALFCGSALLVAARADARAKALSVGFRTTMIAAALTLAAFAFVGFMGNSAIATSDAADRAGDWNKSESKARKAMRWAPWSSEPWRLVGEAEVERGEFAAARASFRTALDKDPRNWFLWFDLAGASKERARKQALDDALRLNPHSPEIAESRAALGLPAKSTK